MTTTKLHTCGECVFNSAGYCMRNRMAVKPINYACSRFMTPAARQAQLKARKEERLKKEEMRLNFILTGLFILSTSTMQMLEYFDKQFTDIKAEAKWRFERKRAANEITRCVQRIRDIYQYTFMVDQTEVMTGHGEHAFDAQSYDNHEDDARRWNKLLLHHMESSWQDDAAEAAILEYYESLPHVGIFEKRDFNHFTTK